MAYSILDQLEHAPGTLTADKVAVILGIKLPQVYKMASKPAPQGMPATRVGGQVFFDPATLISWLCRQNPGMAAEWKKARKVAA